jgi:hypothetical protein
MSKPKTLRVVPLTGVMTADSERRPEGVAFDLGTEEAERLISLGHVVEVEKGEVEAGAPVTVLPSQAPAPAPEPPAPEPVEVVMPPADPASAGPRGGKGA